MTKIGIYGGTFDPIHIGHLIIAQQTKEILRLDKIVFLPNGNPPHKNNIHTDEYHRLNMIKLAIEDNKDFIVSEIEINKKDYVYTYDSIRNLKYIYPESIYFIIGQDSLVSLKTWYKYNELISICKFAVMPRKFDNIQEDNIKYIKNYINNNFKENLENFAIIDFPLLDISSTTVRNNIKDKKSLKYLLPDKVIKYIYEENLYET